MSNSPQRFPQSPLLTNVIPGSKRKQVCTKAEQSTSKKARLETNQSTFPCGSLEIFNHEDRGSGEEEAKAIQSPLATKLHSENAEAELRRLQKDWAAPIYAFFKPDPTIEYIDSRRVHVFECIAETCKARGRKPRRVNRYLDKGDARSTSNLRKHAKLCWGAEVVEAADKSKNIELTRAAVADIVSKNSSSSVLDGGGKGKLSYILAAP